MITKTKENNRVARVVVMLLLAMSAMTAWSVTYIADIRVIGGTKSETNEQRARFESQGWVFVDKDLNAGCGANTDYVYLMYKPLNNSNGEGAVTDLYVSNSNSCPTTIVHEGRNYRLADYSGGSHFVQYHGDLNSKAGGDDIHIYFTRDAYDGRKVYNIYFNNLKNGGTDKNGSHSCDGYDLNYGAGGQYIYLHFTATELTGSGSEGNPIVVNNAIDWTAFASNYNSGRYDYQYVRLGDDYDNSTAVNVMVGTPDHPFNGTFDGNGQTLYVDINGAIPGVAPFSVVKDSKIQNLTVTGIVKGLDKSSQFGNDYNGYHSAGLVGRCVDSELNIIQNCRVEATVENPNYAGGIVGHGGSGRLTFKDCIFSGEVKGYTKYAAGLLGWSENSMLWCEDCLVKGTMTPGSGGKHHPIALKWDKANVNAGVHTTYYLKNLAPSGGLGNNAIGGADGTPVSPTYVANEWEREITAVDGNTYYGKTYTGLDMPYSYGFENGMSGWSTYAGRGATGVKTDDKHSGSYSFMFEDCEYDQYLISPELHLTSYGKVEFWIKGGYSSPLGFRVGTSTTTNDIGEFKWTEPQIYQTLTQWSRVEIPELPLGTKYLAINYIETSCSIFVDDFSFTEPYPNPVNLTLDEKTAHSATFSWEAPNATVKQYVYQYQKIGDGDRWAQGTTTNTNVTISGLEAATEYAFRVKAVYDDGGSSSYMIAKFYTPYDTMTLPYSDGFESEFAWTPGSCDTGTGVKAEAKHSGSKGFEFSKTNHQQFIISPQFDGTQPMKVSFYYKNVDKSQPAFFFVGYSTYSDPDNFEFTTDESYVASSGEWELCETYCPVDTRYVVIAWYGDNTKGGALYVDDFVFEVGEPCPWAGSGTVDAPYMITTTGELDALARKVNGGETYEGQYFKMGADLAYQHTTAWNAANSKENNFTAIGSFKDDGDPIVFSGHFDGAGYTISGIRIYKDGTDETSKCQGLFGVVGENAEIKNLTLADTRITGFWASGGLVGLTYDGNCSTSITNCRVAADVAIHAVRDGAHIHGGLVGFNYSSTISNCISSATLTIADEAKEANTSSVYAGLAGANFGFLTNNLVIDATIPATMDNEQAAIVAYNVLYPWPGDNYGGTLEHNLYYNCNVAGVANATNVGYYDLSSYVTADATEDDGALIAIELTKAPANGTAGIDYIAYGGKFYAPANHTVTFTAEGYATYYNSESAITLPPGVKARIVVAVNADGSMTYETIADGDTPQNTVPAGVAVVLTSKTVGQSHKNTSYILTLGGDDTRIFADNLLHGSDEATTTTGGSTYYRMGYDENGKDKGWYWAANGGGAFESSGHEAWLAVPTQAADDTPLPLPGYDRDNVTTSIADRTNNAMPADEPWYTVDGRKVDGKPATKGVYIRNGRKVVIK